MLEGGVAALVLLTALVHASWNALVKTSGDPLLTLAMIMATCSAVAGLATFWVEFPAVNAWPYLGASIVLHGCYNFSLAQAYRLGDLSHVYPIARGIAPLIVAALSACWAGELLTVFQSGALLLVSAGIISLAFGQGWPSREGVRPLLFAVTTGLLIGSYTYVDGQGVRQGEVWGFIAWQIFLAGLPVVVGALVLRRGQIRTFLVSRGGTGALAGLLAVIGYTIVMWAMSLGAMAHVAALRETSVIFGTLIGTLILGESFGRQRVFASSLVAGGVILLSLS